MKNKSQLYIAQMGGGTEQADMYQNLASAVYQSIKRGQAPNDVYSALIQQKIDQNIALKIVSQVVQYMIENGEIEQEDLANKEKEKAKEQQERMMQEQMMQEQSKMQDDASREEMDQLNQQSLDIASDDYGIMSDQRAEEYQNEMDFQDGGEKAFLDQYEKMNEGPGETEDYSKLIDSTAGIQKVNFPGLENYYYDYDPLASDDFNFNYNQPIDNPEIENLVNNEENEAKFGGVNKKRKFTNKVLKLLSKQFGGEDKNSLNIDNQSNVSLQTDDLKNSVKKQKETLISAISNQGKKVAIGNWFKELEKNNDPMLDQILNPPPKENPLSEKIEKDKQISEELNTGQMKKGGSKKYERLARKLYKQIPIPIPKGFNVPISYYDKRAPFVNQRFSTIGGPQINKYFELLAKMYPKAKSAPAQAEEAVIKNNMVDDVVNNSGNTGIDANPIWAQLNNFNTPMYPYQYGGEYGEDEQMVDQFPEYSKNVDDPYFSDITSYPKMQNGGDISEFTHYTHGENSIFKTPMNFQNKAQFGLETLNNPYLQQLTQLLENSRYRPKDIRKAMRNQRKMTGNTYRDALFPANRFLQYSGSYAQQMGLPFLGDDGQTYLGDVSGPLAKREVTKRGILGRPKEWTDYYLINDDGSFSSIDLSNTNKITLDPYNQNVPGMSGTDKKIARRDERLNRNTPAESDAYQFTSTLTGSQETPVKEPMSNEEMLKSQGRAWDEKQKRWLSPLETKNMNNALEKQEKAYGDYQSKKLSSNDITNLEKEYGDLGPDSDVITSSFQNYDEFKKFMDSGPTQSQLDDKLNQGLRIRNKQLDPSDDLEYFDKDTQRVINQTRMELNPMGLQFGGYIPNYMAYGGYLPKAGNGLENTPISYTGNPIFAGQKEVDMTVNNTGNTNLQQSAFWNDQQSFNAPAPTAPKEMQQQNEELTKYTVDPNQIEEYQAPKQFQGLVGVNRKRKDMYTVDFEAGLNSTLAGVKGGLGIINNNRSKKDEAQLYAKNYDPTKVYGKKERIDTGDYDVNTGIYNIADTGSNRLGSSKKYGGYMQEGGFSDEPFLEEGEEVDFTPEELEQFLAAGGQVEYL